MREKLKKGQNEYDPFHHTLHVMITSVDMPHANLSDTVTITCNGYVIITTPLQYLLGRFASVRLYSNLIDSEHFRKKSKLS